MHEQTEDEKFFPFDPRTTEYSGDNALILADAARLAYKNPTIIKGKIIEEWKFTNFQFCDHDHTQAFIGGNEECIIISFRGTEPKVFGDWITDAKVLPVDGPGGKVHSGFSEGLGNVWRQLLSCLKEFQNNNQSLWFTGHSLGGALATLAVARMITEQKKTVNGLYTFGQPRTGFEDFAQSFAPLFNDKTFRFVNNNDIVPCVPPKKIGYLHVGKLLYFTSRGKLCTRLPWWKILLDKIRGEVENLGNFGPDMLLDHNENTYVDLMKKNTEINPRW